QRRASGASADQCPLYHGARATQGDCSGHRRSAARGHRADRRQRTREAADHARGRGAVRRRRGGVRGAALAGLRGLCGLGKGGAMRLPLGRIAEFIGTTGAFDAAAVAGGYSIDSRTLAPGELFFAVKGERLDGHEFVELALAAGALAAVVEREQAARYGGQHRVLAVADPLAALQRLGTAVRRLWG